MKHIFMGQINTIESYCQYSYVFNPHSDSLCITRQERVNNFAGYLSIREHIIGILGIFSANIKTEYKKILETDLIQERCLENSCVKFDDEEYYINKVVQCTNGDVICYTNKVIKEIQDENSLETCNKIIKDFEKYRIQRMKQKREEKKLHKKKKWYELWKKEGD